jgi:hypothetical protein
VIELLDWSRSAPSRMSPSCAASIAPSSQGLKVMAASGNVGLAALAEVARLTGAPRCADLGFALGPASMQAAGSASRTLGVRCSPPTIRPRRRRSRPSSSVQ